MDYKAIHSKYDSKIKGVRLRTGSIDGHEKKDALLDSLNAEKDARMFAMKSEQSEAIRNAKNENEVMKANHKAWCSTFGQNLSILSIFFVLVFLLSFGWCQWFLRFEIDENESILSEQAKDHESKRFETKAKDSFRVKEVVKDIEKQPVSNIGFNNQDKYFNRKEGDVLKGIAPKVDRVFVLKDNGDLKAYTLGGLNNLIKGSSEDRSKHLESLKLKLIR